MFRRIKLIPVILAAAVAVAGCGERGGAVAGNNSSSSNLPTGQNTVLAQAGTTGGMCGGIAGIQCAAESDFCKNAAGQCSTADAAGACTTRPQICTKQYVPVCGCDGKTYGNQCEADSAGVSVQSAGACPAVGARS